MAMAELLFIDVTFENVGVVWLVWALTCVPWFELSLMAMLMLLNESVSSSLVMDLALFLYVNTGDFVCLMALGFGMEAEFLGFSATWSLVTWLSSASSLHILFSIPSRTILIDITASITSDNLSVCTVASSSSPRLMSSFTQSPSTLRPIKSSITFSSDMLVLCVPNT